MLTYLWDRRNQKGFTLIELLVVVAIIALLAAFAVPRLFEAINSAKKAPGDADVQTISAALERYYFDNSSYPASADLKSKLVGEFLKHGTSWQNGYKRGYLYISGTDASGKSYYVLVDPKNYTGGTTKVKVECGTWIAPDGGAGTGMTVNVGTSTTPADVTLATFTTVPTTAQIATGCHLHQVDATGAVTGDPLDARIITY